MHKAPAKRIDDVAATQMTIQADDDRNDRAWLHNRQILTKKALERVQRPKVWTNGSIMYHGWELVERVGSKALESCSPADCILPKKVENWPSSAIAPDADSSKSGSEDGGASD